MELTGAARPSGSGVLRQGSRRFAHVAPEVQENDDGKLALLEIEAAGMLSQIPI